MKKRKKTRIKLGLVFLYLGILAIGVGSWLLIVYGLVSLFGI